MSIRNGRRTTVAQKPKTNSAPKALRLNGIAVALVSAGFYVPAFSEEPTESVQLPVVEVIGTTPIDGLGIPRSEFPANAQRLTAKDAAEQGTSNVADLLNNNIGSVSVSNGTGNPYQNDVNYRGFQATSLLGAPVGLSVYFDGVRMNEPFGSVVNWDLIPTNAMSSINILPGSNPIFGLNTLGGAIVVNTKNGKDDPGTSISALGGSFRRRGVSFESGWADATHGTDYFISGNYDRQDGYRDYSGSEIKQLFGKARWLGNGGQTKLELSGALADTELSGTQSLPLDMLSNYRSAYTWPDTISNRMALLNLKASHWLNDSNQIVGNVYYRHTNLNNFNSNADLDDGCFNDDGSLATTTSGTSKCANQAPGGTAVNSITGANALALGYGRWTSSINSSVVESTTRQDTVGTSLQWSNFDKLLGHNNTFTLGTAFDHSRISYDQDAYLARLIDYQTVIIPNQEYGFTANGLAPSATNLPSFTGSNVLNSVNLSASTNDFSAYFTDTFHLTEKLSVTASGSFNLTTLSQAGANNQYLNDDGGYSWTDSVTGVTYYNPGYVDAFKYSNSGTGAATSPNGIPAGAVAGPETKNLNGSHDYRRFNPALGFNYSLNPALGLFGGYSEAMRAPTSIELSCADPTSPCSLPTGFNGDPDLKPVVARTFELGARGRLGNSTYWNAAMYDSRLSNDIQFIATSATYGYFANVGKTERRGFEIGASTNLGKLFFAANLGYVQARYKSEFTTASGQNVVSGDTIPGIPARTLKIRSAYAVNTNLLLGAGLIAASSQFAHGNESNSDPAGVVPGYVVFNLDAHYNLTKNLNISAYINNLFDKRYSTYGLSGTTSIYTLVTQQFVTPAAPRSFWISLTYSFGGKRADRDSS
ncbi:TonB-dependent receptor [Paraburkholderia unamae]|uniref:Outer membrane receptor protein involved in Fe transport n=1 Tax=Paraburkholderia unamae TaxID=219649 RepID=A0ABX5K6G4_9BURK|nr:TonB-dependent receptor [Paraburkholderia unamae]PVX61028.1 outer membrane receptor protein involved in Fe transport [Paraburkholderia unamae]